MGDTTYKLIEKDILLVSPILTLDLDHNNRLVGLIISQYENTDTYIFGLQTIKNTIEWIYRELLEIP